MCRLEKFLLFEDNHSLRTTTWRTLPPISYLEGPETCLPGAFLGCFRTWWGLKHAHQARFWGVFVPGAFGRLGKEFVSCFG
jgi:hypothetical protein